MVELVRVANSLRLWRRVLANHLHWHVEGEGGRARAQLHPTTPGGVCACGSARRCVALLTLSWLSSVPRPPPPLDTNSKELELIDWGVSHATLEEVFVKLSTAQQQPHA